MSPSIPGQLRGRSGRDHTTGLPRLPLMVWAPTTSAPRSWIEGPKHAIDQRRVDLRHIAEADDGAVDLLRQGRQRRL